MIRWQRNPVAPHVIEAKPEPEPVREAWCENCGDWTERDPLAGRKEGGETAPTFWVCARCGVVDFSFMEEEAS